MFPINQLLEHARNEKAKSNYLTALDDYSQTLTLDTNHLEAFVGFLEVSALSHLSAPQKIYLYQIHGLFENRIILNEKIQYYRNKILSLESKLVLLGISKEQQQKFKENYYQEFPLKQDKNVRAIAFDIGMIQPQSLPILAQVLGDEVLHLRQILDHSKGEIQTLQYIQTKTTIKNTNAVYVSAKTPELNTYYSSNVLEGGQNNIDEFTIQTFNLRKELSGGKDKIEGLASEVIRLSLEVSEREIEVKNNYSVLSRLQNQLIDLDSRLSFGKRLIKNKNDKINDLEQQLSDIKISGSDQYNQLSMELSLKQKKADEFQGILRIYKEKLRDAYEGQSMNNQRFDKIKGKLLNFKNNLNYRDDELNQTRNILVNLEQEIGIIREYIQTVHVADDSQDQITLNDLTQIEQKLFQTRRFLYEYSSELQELHEILSRP